MINGASLTYTLGGECNDQSARGILVVQPQTLVDSIIYEPHHLDFNFKFAISLTFFDTRVKYALKTVLTKSLEIR